MSTRQLYGKKVLGALVSLTILVACIPQVAKIDPTIYDPDIDSPIQIPAVCKSAYEAAIVTRVGVVDFTNNSFGKVGVPVGWRWWREVEMKLPETVADGVIDEIVNMGGAKVFTRTEMHKVLEEHKFQMSGHVDDETLIKFGRLAGLQHIITGSINDMNFATTTEERGYYELFTKRKGTKMVTETKADVELGIRMLDVTTGEIILSTRVRGRETLGGGDAVTVISAIKKACGDALKDIRPEFSKRFTIKGYILQTRTSPDGKERSALINIGEKQGMKGGYKVIIYTFQEIKDPFTGKSICDKVKLPVEGEVTDQIQEDKAWILIKGDINQVRRLKTGALVERAPLKKPGIFDDIFKSK
jgi:curli biogenesis system outer membrane secretion channel CsgG